LSIQISFLDLNIKQRERDMTLTEKLTIETQELKKAYIEKTIIWAKDDFQSIKQAVSDHKYTTEGTKEWWAMERKMEKLPLCFWRNDIDTWIEIQVESAKKHYANSIVKLAQRIEKKDLNQDKLELTTSYMDLNISTTITDGEKKVRAYTIIACGEIQKPHYRYLVK
jgi:ribosome-binding ATPase YchF (GTP1/OBG family)